MPISMWCVLFAGVLPILTSGLAKRGDRSFDNSKPREWAQTAEDWRKRAVAAQQNAFEAFPFFAAAVLVAWTQGGPQEWIDRLAIVFVVVRLAYLWAYVANRPTLRSTIWSIGFLVCVAIFTSSLWAGGPPA
ncbi:MAPEG family protein [Hansschlegelia plantiphila]|uniref:Membrane protein n=1 Tax=Hansschlegelia plantiphila TaxID=374655 RepID=A0A9W6J3D8_9HYPH|nr:MAPEG family protein [Hansschlegelia plantiphila]GLK68629.1 membrane protein [Hansschlegelia plantiphila]